MIVHKTKQNTNYEEWRKAVIEHMSKDACAKAYPESFAQVLKEHEQSMKKDYEAGDTASDVAWGLCLLI